jgi:hypothetical protein
LNLELPIVGLGDLDPGEEILDEGREQRKILCEELWYVGVTHRSDKHDIL